MFGLGAGELLVLLVVALLFLGPEKLPDAAKTISKGIRDFRKQTRELQETLEEDTQIGDAYRDLKSALRGDELRSRPSPPPPRKAMAPDPATDAPALDSGEATAGTPAVPATEAAPETDDELPLVRPATGAVARGPASPTPDPDPDAPESNEDQKAHG